MNSHVQYGMVQTMISLSQQRLLVIAPHADDEVLGCGGLIHKIKKAGGQVFVLFLTNGDTKDFSKKGTSSVSERMQEIENVAAFLQFDAYHIGFTGNEYHLKLDAHGQQKVIHLIERDSPVSIEKVKPTMIAFPSLYSYNQDHQLAARATHAALRPVESETKHFIPIVLAYEMPADQWSLHNQTPPNFLVRLSREEMDAKINAMNLYASQTRPFPNLRSSESIEAMGRVRGALSSHEFAEAYLSYRFITE